MTRPVAASEPLTPIAAASYGFEQITVTASSAATLKSLLTGTVIPPETRHAIFYPESEDVRWRADGTAPTASIGLVMAKDTQTVFENQGPIFEAMKLISAGSSSVTVNVHFFK